MAQGLGSTAPSPAVDIVDVLSSAADVQTAHRQFSLRNAQIYDRGDGRLFNLTFGPHRRENYYSPRHRHNFDQIRLVVSGRAKYGSLRMDQHDVCYFPEGVFYGPAEVLSDCATTCVIQTQGASWSRLMTAEEQARAARELASRGAFDTARGLFRHHDGRVQDSYEALLELTLGRPVSYPEPRYHYPVLLRSGLFSWQAVPGEAGVDLKPLASFAGGPAINWIRLDGGASATMSPSSRHQLLVVVEGAIACDGSTRPTATPGTFIHLGPGASMRAAAVEPSLALLCEFDSRP